MLNPHCIFSTTRTVLRLILLSFSGFISICIPRIRIVARALDQRDWLSQIMSERCAKEHQSTDEGETMDV